MLSADKTKAKSSKGKRSRENSISSPTVEVADYRHKEEKRKNIPDAGLATYNYKSQEPLKYSYDPHLDPQLIWSGKSERPAFEVETVSLHIHERISTRAILKSVQIAEQLRQLRLFGDPDLPFDKRIEFYQHEMDWTNRLILGDSLLVMNSLKERELMEGKVQMIYMDPPYGISYSSNFQTSIGKRDVKDKDDDLTRDPEQIKAYRDTWTLGIHSYLTYLRDRLLLCSDLLHQSGSIFVQINDENLHFVRNLLDEVFGRENFVAVIAFAKTGGMGGKLLGVVNDFLLWYAKDREQVKYRQLYLEKKLGGRAGEAYTRLQLLDGKRRQLTKQELENSNLIPTEGKAFSIDNLTSQGFSANTTVKFNFEGRNFHPGANNHWKTTLEGLQRLGSANRIFASESQIRYVRYFDDFGVVPLTTVWDDTSIAGYGEPKLFVVQTNTKVIERCILMTTDPGDLVLDPTCGSGTTAYCAEKWGRRWITCDTSRVALALARQRLMTAKYDYYELANFDRGPSGGFSYDALPHIKLENIAHDTGIDVIASQYENQIEEALSELNSLLGKKWKEWEVPPGKEHNWPAKAKQIHGRILELKLEMRRKIEERVRNEAEQEVLYDHPRVKRNLVRVSGPFTVEAIPMPALETPIASRNISVMNASPEHVKVMIEILQKDGVTFPNGKKLLLANLRLITSPGFIHAEGETGQNGEVLRVAVSFGPRYGPVSGRQVDEAIRLSFRLGFDVLVLAGFAFEPEAQATIQKNPIPKLSVHMAHISPDVIVGDLLKPPRHKGSQLFAVFGEPDVKLEKDRDEFKVRLLGVDLYDPTTRRSSLK